MTLSKSTRSNTNLLPSTIILTEYLTSLPETIRGTITQIGRYSTKKPDFQQSAWIFSTRLSSEPFQKHLNRFHWAVRRGSMRYFMVWHIQGNISTASWHLTGKAGLNPDAKRCVMLVKRQNWSTSAVFVWSSDAFLLPSQWDILHDAISVKLSWRSPAEGGRGSVRLYEPLPQWQQTK